MGFSRQEGSEAGAILVIANNAREAKKLAWRSGECLNVDEWIDLAVRLIRGEGIMALADQEKLRRDIQHVVAEPLGCEACGLWGAGVRSNGECCYCGEPAGEALVCLLCRDRRGD